MPRKCGLCKKEGHNRTNCENAHYKGEYNYKGERHGKGTYEYKLSKYNKTSLKNAKYVGDWVEGKREGKGVMIWEHYNHPGSKYEGEWKNDKRHGKGTFTWSNGDKYEGEWKNGKTDGKGNITYKNGDYMEGNWKEGKKVKGIWKGIIVREKYSKYEGQISLSIGGYGREWKVKQGSGIIVFNNRIKIDADWDNNKIKKCHSVTIDGVKCENYEQIYIRNNSEYLNYFNTYNDRAEKQIILFRSGRLIIKHKNLEEKKSEVFKKNVLIDRRHRIDYYADKKYEYTNKFIGICLNYVHEDYGILLEGKGSFYKRSIKEHRKTQVRESVLYEPNETMIINREGLKVELNWDNLNEEEIKCEGFNRVSTCNFTRDNSNNYTITYNRGHTYKGQCELKKESYSAYKPFKIILKGKGIKTWADGNKYDGEWKDDKKHGHGVYTFANGTIYDGKWKNDNKHGHGVQTWADGTKYDGNWDNGNYRGYGIKTYANGDKYEGEWRNTTDGSFYYNHGIKTYVNGDKYDGYWIGGKYSGKGVKTYANGDKYDGWWKYGKYRGQGVMTYANGDTYNGGWEEGKYGGQGVMTYANGDTFRGWWEKDMRDGTGIMNTKDGLRYEGVWRKDKKEERFNIFKGDDFACICDFKDDKLIKRYKSIDENIFI